MSPVRFLEKTTLPAPIIATLITAAAAGAQIEYPGSFQAALVTHRLQDVFDECFRVGPGNQHLWRDVKLEIEEVRPAGEIRDRLLIRGPPHQRAIAAQIVVRQNPVIFDIKLDARRSQHMGQEQFGRQSGGLDLLAGKKSGGPLKNPSDRPCSDLGHRRMVKGDREADNFLVIGDWCVTRD
jgi:hypothetical protein